ncbi:heparan-alpha-glucosaminide N-acetyltransferase isoform X2 [Solanum pennellii]|uniref:Heparan-alpha-glucosaminide N-acetyltransferase isoform X2 n=1 Tax=Solanum pennellii TaxID=28526 RepID=A0ABM1FM87_SOLPN|nr:heparan-alpha-glucosaminide N-acetyltransferase isoform X2 [Solanum pennellii]
MGSYQLIREKKDARLRWDPQQLQLGDIIVEGEGKNLSPRIEVITSDATSNLEKSPTSPLSTLPKSIGDHGGPHSHRSKTGGGSGRLLSLDIFRGITVALMIFVEYAGGIYPAINHSPWDGITLADFVMPFFLFIVGVSLALGYKNMPCRLTATGKAIHRALKLLILGLFLQGGYFHGIKNLTYGVDVERIRWMGILQRIAISFLLAAMCEIWLKGDNKVNSGQSLLKRYHQQWAMAIMVTALYLSLFYGLYVSDWEYQMPMDISSSEAKIFTVKCGLRGDSGPACNAVGMIDRKILGIQHLYARAIYGRSKECSVNSPNYGPLPLDAPSWCQAPFDPEGLLSSLMAIVTCFIGLHYGHIIVHFKDHKVRIQQWLVPSSCLVLLGVTCDCLGMHANKVDVWGYRHWTTILKWMGTNALLIYILVSCNILPVLLQGFYWRRPENNILTMIGVGPKK